ncbi:protein STRICTOSIDINE SYNTHASE-LIKE 4-like [Prunus avium]|uniref:Protein STRICTOSIDINE SYNTHASE-LIKE 4-like n=1 Tax=Prunus avium TaxID=42229 RepID=A0A6P5TUI4_PRUAV|nr:protein STRICTOSIDINE SYNTHASE-LIKE 4-like [Prunus avium]
MSESKNPVDSAESSSQTQPSNSWPSATTSLFLILILTIFTATLVYQLDSFDPAPLPYHELTRHFIRRAPAHNPLVLPGLEFVGYGVLLGPEDVAYHSESGLIYTGCEDGWVKRVKLNDSQNPSEFAVDSWVNTGGRPLGLNFGLHNEVLVCDTDQYLRLILHSGRSSRIYHEADPPNVQKSVCQVVLE